MGRAAVRWAAQPTCTLIRRAAPQHAKKNFGAQMEDDAPVEHAIPRVLDMVLASRARTYDMFHLTTEATGYPPLYADA